MKLEIERLLYKARVFHSYRGYAFFEQAVILACEDPERLLYVCKELYAPIAIKHHTTVSIVEKDLRTVRDVFMRNGGKKVLHEMGFEYCSEHPYPRELIEIFASYFRADNNTPKIK